MYISMLNTGVATDLYTKSWDNNAKSVIEHQITLKYQTVCGLYFII